MRFSKKFYILILMAAFFAACATPSRAPENEKIVAVWNPDDLSFQPSAWPDLGELLGSQVAAYIGNSGTHSVVA